MPDVETADDLYGLNLADFTAARDRLSRRLKREGRRDEAADVSKLRRPPTSAWALNVLARADPSCIEAVLSAATELRDAIGDQSIDLHAAQMGYRDAIDAAVVAASSMAGITSDDMRSRIRTNLLAGGVDEEVARQLRTGTLPDDQDAPGFAAMPTIGPNPRRLRLVPQPETPEPSEPSKRPPGDGRKEADLRRQAQEEAAAAAERKRVAEQRAKLERELEQLERRAQRLATEADTAEERAVSARQAADRADAMRDELAERIKRL